MVRFELKGNRGKKIDVSLVNKTCYMCNRKIGRDYRDYVDDNGNPIQVCHLCVEYAERRAYRRT